MKKLLLSLLIIGSTFSAAIAQDYKKVFFKDLTIENNHVKVTVEDAVATPAGIKFRLKIFNKTNDYVVYKPVESSFKIGGKDYKPEEKWLIIRPNEDDYRTVNLKGAGFVIPENFNFVLSGLYKFSPESPGVSAPDFKLPAAQNEFKAGNFTVTLVKFKKETARTDAKFKVTYSGDKIGIFEPNKVAMKMPDGKEFANFYSDKKPLIFAKGDMDDFAVAWKDIPNTSGDMQKVDMNILWRNAFKEITPDKIDSQILNLQFDKEMSDAKGK
ncbi:MAG: hypothetical protein M3R27_15270 [Bacteroidota bacterium]|nr:hypothetical protein [Bacteroidota bacterium]